MLYERDEFQEGGHILMMSVTVCINIFARLSYHNFNHVSVTVTMTVGGCSCCVQVWQAAGAGKGAGCLAC